MNSNYDRIEMSLKYATIIDDDYSGLDSFSTNRNSQTIEELNLQKSPKKINCKYNRKKQNDPKFNDFQNFLESFKEKKIVPSPIIFSRDFNSEKSLITEMMLRSDFSIIDYKLGETKTALNIINDCIDNKNIIWPLIIISKQGIGKTITAFNNNREYIRAEISPPTFYLEKNPGIFVQIYQKQTFKPEKARKNLAKYISSAYQNYSLSALEYYSTQKKELKLVLDPSQGKNLDSAIMIHAYVNNYESSQLNKFLLDIFNNKCYIKKELDFESFFLNKLSLKIRYYMKNIDELRKNIIDATETIKVDEKIKKYFDNNKNNNEIKKYFNQIKYNKITLENFFKSLNNAVTNWNLPKEDKMKKIPLLLIYTIFSNEFNKGNFSNFILSLIKYEFPQEDKVIWPIIVKSKVKSEEKIFHGLKNGEILVNSKQEKNLIIIDKKTKIKREIKGSLVLFLITPTCDIFRPEKVENCVKFITGILFKDKEAKDVEDNDNIKGCIEHIRYFEEGGKKNLIRLNFGDITTFPLPFNNKCSNRKAHNIWKNFESLLILRPQFADEIINKYISYQSRIGVEEFYYQE